MGALTSVVPKRNSFESGVKAWISDAVSDLNSNTYADESVKYLIPLHASKVIYNVFVARRGYQVTSIDYTPDTAQGGALTATVVKATGTATPASATTPMHAAAGINLNGTAHTVQSITLTSTAADLVLAAGERIAIVLSGAMTVGSGNLSIRMTKV